MERHPTLRTPSSELTSTKNTNKDLQVEETF